MKRKELKKRIVLLSSMGLMIFANGLMAQQGVVVDPSEVIEECLNDGLFTKQFSESIFSNIETYYVVNNSTIAIPTDFEVNGKSVVESAEGSVTADTYFTLESVSIVGERATILYDFHYTVNGVATVQSMEAELGVFNGHWSTMNSTLIN